MSTDFEEKALLLLKKIYNKMDESNLGNDMTIYELRYYIKKNILNVIEDKIIDEITSNSEQFSKIQVTKFIMNNYIYIKKIRDHIFNDYNNDYLFEDILNMENDFVRIYINMYL
jgi:hypothetical protein